eukprot:6224927-Amphidinium_carterae.1
MSGRMPDHVLQTTTGVVSYANRKISRGRSYLMPRALQKGLFGLGNALEAAGPNFNSNSSIAHSA